ncbi:C40 family peptidase [Palleronia pelagia]|uniref:Putative phage cell wall peptidase, NlpC/P60 family n=1 Tax=Palleronia pelagia TaxID=387096 RepID=A0A1H8I4P7_9RHOB|nr:peptidase [Palleronia pelagia]SEN63157.1 putative phage cell wall peptidase, NlpC/P60 family [Palleronia pelagia]
MSARIVAAARAWIGTPYIHQASTRAAGTDCLGLIRGVWRDVIGAEPLVPPPYTADWSEPQRSEDLWRAARRHLRDAPPGPPAPGQVLLFRMRDGAVAKHLGIVGQGGETPTFIHAFAGHAVVETALSAPWRRRVVARFTFPEGDT